MVNRILQLSGVLKEEGEIGNSGASIATGTTPVNDVPPSGSNYAKNENDLSCQLVKLKNGGFELRISSEDLQLLKRIKFHVQSNNGVPD